MLFFWIMLQHKSSKGMIIIIIIIIGEECFIDSSFLLKITALKAVVDDLSMSKQHLNDTLDSCTRRFSFEAILIDHASLSLSLCSFLCAPFCSRLNKIDNEVDDDDNDEEENNCW